MNQPLVIASILGLVQGLTEFIPISSSGHLVIIRELFGWVDQGVFFDGVLHLATLAAVLIYFRKEWAALARAIFKRKATSRAIQADRRLWWLLVVATIPAIGLAPWLEPWVDQNFRGMLPIAIFMILTGGVIWLVDHYARRRYDINKLTPARALGIGLAQALSVLPGVSRSGATIAAGMYMELEREAAAKFSFMMAAPVVALAGGYSLYHSIKDGALNSADYLFWLVAFGVSLVSGLLAIKFLLAFLKRYPLDIFVYYRVIAGLGLIGLYLWR